MSYVPTIDARNVLPYNESYTGVVAMPRQKVGTNAAEIAMLREALAYDPQTGIFTWKVRPYHNSRKQAGDVAGRTQKVNGGSALYIGYLGVDYVASRVAWAFHYGEWPSRRLQFVDGNSHNLAIKNIRLALGGGLFGFDHQTPEGRAAYGKAHRNANPDLYADKDLRKTFGITLAQYNEMSAAQGGLCAICGQPERSMRGGKLKRLAVDHDHDAGAVRALLCTNCNPMLGYAGDSPDILRKAAVYLERFKKEAA
jgi:Recombination endonuclease VII